MPGIDIETLRVTGVLWRHGWNQKGAVTSHDSFALRAPGVTQPS